MRRAKWVRVTADQGTTTFAHRVTEFILTRFEIPSIHMGVLVGLLIGYELGRRDAPAAAGRKAIG